MYQHQHSKKLHTKTPPPKKEMRSVGDVTAQNHTIPLILYYSAPNPPYPPPQLGRVLFEETLRGSMGMFNLVKRSAGSQKRNQTGLYSVLRLSNLHKFYCTAKKALVSIGPLALGWWRVEHKNHTNKTKCKADTTATAKG